MARRHLGVGTVSLLGLVLAHAASGGCSTVARIGEGGDSGADGSPSTPWSQADVCGNGFDDDQNGRVDDGCPCGPGEVQRCFGGDLATRDRGACSDGQQTCVPRGVEWGDWGDSPCEGDVIASEEQCDGRDHDCDGALDDGCPCAAGESRDCGLEFLVGECRAGTQTCRVDGSWSGCDGAVSARPEICDNGLDEDCDGEVDELCGCAPEPELCRDGIDNDCDGAIDEPACEPDWPPTERIVEVPRSCVADALGCSVGGSSCDASELGSVSWLARVPAEDPLHHSTDTEHTRSAAAVDRNGRTLTTSYLGTTEEELVLAVHETDGSLRWTTRVRYASSPESATFDQMGNVYVFGEYAEPSPDFGAGPLPPPAYRTTSGVALLSGYLVSYDDRGRLRWSRYVELEPPNRRTSGGLETPLQGRMITDDAGSLYLTTGRGGRIDFGGGLVPAASPADILNVFVASFDTDGTHRWSRAFGGDERVWVNEFGAGFNFDRDGSLLLSGRVWGTVDFGGIVRSLGTGSGESGATGYVVSIDPSSGAARWARTYPLIHLYEAEPGPCGYVVAGRLWDGADLGCGPVRCTATDSCGFVATYDADWNLLWSRILEGGQEHVVWDIDVDLAGNVFALGQILEPDGDLAHWPSRSPTVTAAGERSLFAVFDVRGEIVVDTSWNDQGHAWSDFHLHPDGSMTFHGYVWEASSTEWLGGVADATSFVMRFDRCGE